MQPPLLCLPSHVRATLHPVIIGPLTLRELCVGRALVDNHRLLPCFVQGEHVLSPNHAPHASPWGHVPVPIEVMALALTVAVFERQAILV